MTADHPEVAFDDAGLPARVVDFDRACRTCGYNLRGLAGSGECPECRTPVIRSLHDERLCYSDPRWVRTLSRGMSLLNTALGGAVILIVVTLLVLPMRSNRWLPTSLALCMGGVAVAGAWLVTQRDPAALDHERPLTWRRVLRIAVLAAVALEAADDVLAHSTGMTRPLATSARVLGSAMWIVVILAAFRHAMNLARLVPDLDLVQQTRAAMWGLISSYAFASVIAVLMLSNVQLPPILTAMFGLSCTIIVACVVFTLWSMSLIARYTHVLRTAADEAELTWKYGRAGEQR